MTTDFNRLYDEFLVWFDPKGNRDELLAQTAQFLKERVYHYDWVGFYILNHEKNELVLGPFSGKPTEHTHIPVGKGVCGQVAESKSPKIVQDVNQEANYISCSIDVQSEIVVPVIKNGVFIAEIDIDSHSPSPFNQADVQFLESVCKDIANLF